MLKIGLPNLGIGGARKVCIMIPDHPTTQADSIAFSNVAQTTLTVSWSRGNGSKVAVFMKAASSGSALPVDATTYTANTAFGSGTQIGATGWYCIYNGTSTTVNVTGLTAETTYRVMACEYNGNAGAEVYNTSTTLNNPKNQLTTVAAPTIQAFSLVFSNVASTTLDVSWTNGNGSKRALFAKQDTTGTASPANLTTYIADADFGNGDEIGSSGWYCLYNGTGTTVSVTGLTLSTSYRFMVCEYNGAAGNEAYKTDAATDNPLTQATTDGWDIIFYDTFTEGGGNVNLESHTPDTGTSWTKEDTGTAVVNAAADNVQVATGTNGAPYTANPASQPTGKIRAWYDVQINSAGSAATRQPAIGIRWKDSDNSHIRCYYQWSSTTFAIRVFTAVNTPGTTLVTGTGLPAFQVNQWYRFYVENDPSTGAILFRLYQPDFTTYNQITYTTSTNQAENKTGQILGYGTNTGTDIAKGDNFKIEEYAG